jgi:hypothetical protein
MTGPNRGDASMTALPDTLAARPRDPRRGLPIPPVNLHPESNGDVTVDFTNINTTVSTDLATHRRCSLCGVEMGYWVAFLGGPRAAALMRYTDPPGCPERMRAAVRLCPFIKAAQFAISEPYLAANRGVYEQPTSWCGVGSSNPSLWLQCQAVLRMLNTLAHVWQRPGGTGLGVWRRRLFNPGRW